MKYLAVMLCGATLLSGCYFEEDDISSSDRQEQLPIVQNDAPQGTRVVPGEQVMSSGRYRNDIQVANGAAAIKATANVQLLTQGRGQQFHHGGMLWVSGRT